ncbi:MAG: hypothetical protein HFF06_03415 [Oscillospiraceae bacterium]|jgi:hypothetical protein|nr:hypothetical protein [Oscillospiraceae bacterium]
MQDILFQLYYMIDEFLPMVQYPSDAQQALEATFTLEQEVLWENYQQEAFYRDDGERRILFNYLVKLGLHIP